MPSGRCCDRAAERMPSLMPLQAFEDEDSGVPPPTMVDVCVELSRLADEAPMPSSP
jgi:hypothetical protein